MCFFMRLFSKQFTEPRIFKKRIHVSSAHYDNTRFFKQSYGLQKRQTTNVKKTVFVATTKSARFELIQYLFFKKLIKCFLKKPRAYSVFSKKVIWIFWKPNYPLTKKSKNSRMGKGKGLFLRWTVRVPSHFILFFILLFTSSYMLSKAMCQLTYKVKPCCYSTVA